MALRAAIQTYLEAIDTYHGLLDDDIALASYAQLEERQRARGLLFGERSLCTVLRPRFMTGEQYHYVQREVGVLLRAFARAHQRALADTDFRGQFGLSAWEDALVQLDPGFRAPSPTSRLDTFYFPETDSLKVTEYNAETPAAPAYNDVLSDIFYALPVMRAFLHAYDVRPVLARHSVLNVLLDAYEQWSGGRREAPRIAILDWREVPTYSEHVLFVEYFRSHGFECVTADPRAVEYRNGRLMLGDFHITLLYKRVLLTELVERGGLDHPIVRALRDRAVCMVNPFACKILHKKASLAVLSDERNADLFPPDEARAIEAHIPWTRTMEERYTTYQGQRVDLVPFVLAHREQLVLKANDEYGGKGIVLGWTVDNAEWEQAVAAALRAPFIAQERIDIPREEYPSVVDGRLRLGERIMDTAPFIFYGDYVDGCLTRLSTDALVNVTAGGGSTVPTFLVEQR